MWKYASGLIYPMRDCAGQWTNSHLSTCWLSLHELTFLYCQSPSTVHNEIHCRRAQYCLTKNRLYFINLFPLIHPKSWTSLEHPKWKFITWKILTIQPITPPWANLTTHILIKYIEKYGPCIFVFILPWDLYSLRIMDSRTCHGYREFPHLHYVRIINSQCFLWILWVL